jgi:RimJ/RimL family protein N-acetyltransferase
MKENNMKKIKLKDIVEEMEIHSDEVSSYLNKKTGEIYWLREEEKRSVDDENIFDIEVEVIEKAEEILYNDNWIQLPTKFDIHEWGIMNDFCYTVRDDYLRDGCLKAIHGSGAFRMFKDYIYRYDLREKWFKFRENAYREIAKDWCERNGIEYEEEIKEEPKEEVSYICESERLYIREVQYTDISSIIDWKSDPLVKKMALGPDIEISREKEEQYISKDIESENELYLILVKREEDIPIGYIRINWLDKNHLFGWLRFALGKERGKGYAYEGLKSLLSHLFNKGLHRMDAEVYENNEAALNLLKKLGFKQEGIKREAHFDGEKFIDIIVLGLLREDFIER